jgi:hypothetical protein
MEVKKMEAILNNLWNGNLSDFRDDVKKLKKYEIVELIQFHNETCSNSEKEMFLVKLYNQLTIN